jgi:hypothetical protein
VDECGSRDEERLSLFCVGLGGRWASSEIDVIANRYPVTESEKN